LLNLCQRFLIHAPHSLKVRRSLGARDRKSISPSQRAAL
jgi:hypothetical protein